MLQIFIKSLQGRKSALKALILVICCFVVQKATAQQEYVPFQDSALWSVNYAKYMTLGDTIVQGQSYLKLYRQEDTTVFDFDIEKATLTALLRNDTPNRQVYVIEDFNTMQENLLYDFSLKVGDTVSVNLFGQKCKVQRCAHGFLEYAGGDIYSRTFEDTTITLLDGSQRNLFIIQDVKNDKFHIWIEGIGSLFGPLKKDGLFMGCIVFFHFNSLLHCYEQNGERLLIFPEFDLNEPVGDCYTFKDQGLNINQYQSDRFIKIFPNPSDNIVNIEFQNTNDWQNANLRIYNMLGKCVWQQDVNSNITGVDISHLSSGLYVLKIEVVNTQSMNFKLLKK